MKKIELTFIESHTVASALEAQKERFNKWINGDIGKIDEEDKQSAIRHISELDSIINKLK